MKTFIASLCCLVLASVSFACPLTAQLPAQPVAVMSCQQQAVAVPFAMQQYAIGAVQRQVITQTTVAQAPLLLAQQYPVGVPVGVGVGVYGFGVGVPAYGFGGFGGLGGFGLGGVGVNIGIGRGLGLGGFGGRGLIGRGVGVGVRVRR